MANAAATIEDVRYHDIFNIVALAIIGPMDLYYLYHATEWEKLTTPALGKEHEFLAQLTMYLFFSYLVVDIIWIIIRPSSVQAKPLVIILHHACTLILVLIPLLDTRYSWHGMIDLVSEINTLCLTIRRQLPRKGRSDMAYSVVNVFFYITWFVSRVFLFPALAALFYYEYFMISLQMGTFFNWLVIGPILQTALVIFSYYWTYLMIFKKGESAELKSKRDQAARIQGASGEDSVDATSANAPKDSKLKNEASKKKM